MSNQLSSRQTLSQLCQKAIPGNNHRTNLHAHTNLQYSNTIITHVAYDEITYVENITRECFNLNLKIACSISHFVFNILKGEKAMHVH